MNLNFMMWIAHYGPEEIALVGALNPTIPILMAYLKELSLFPDRDTIQSKTGMLLAQYIDALIVVKSLKEELSEQAPTIQALEWEVKDLTADNAALRTQIKKLLDEKRESK